MNNTIDLTDKNVLIAENSFNKLIQPHDSTFQLVIIAGNRCKQLTRGAKSRLDATNIKRKNTSIAIEEVKQGLVPYREADLFS